MPDVELLYLMDNKRRPVGSKRNNLMGIAEGEYVSFIDDDDEVATDYVSKIYRAITATRKTDTPADVICFPQRCTLQPAGIVHECTYSIKHWKDCEPEQRRTLEKTDVAGTFKWTGPPAHTMVWRRELVGDVKFPDKMFREDVDWVDIVCEKVKVEVQIEGAFLYHYKFDESKTTR